MEIWGEELNEAVKFIFLAAMAGAGIFAGKKLRDRKTAKEAAIQAAKEQD